ncbi:MAG TPA: glycosyltransferase [Kofleriaceae bacterium]|nr:glycosyltransferase [Kofleriaceae bacterium]
MRIAIFGLTVSTAWGNGHAAVWRSLVQGLTARGHYVEFFEKDAPNHRAHRDLRELPRPARLRLYSSWDEVRGEAEAATAAADAAIVSSYCPDGRAACRLVLDSKASARVFYDLDTPVTLARLRENQDVPYLPAEGLGEFDLVLSSTGGRALDLLRDRLGARRVAPLYGSVDPARYRPVAPQAAWAGACSYLGTWYDDRQAALEALFVSAARRYPEQLFVIGGSKLPEHVRWPRNVVHFEHVPPSACSAFYCSSPITISVTRAALAELGYCPPGRLFEAAACGVPVLADTWEGLGTFFTPGEEILTAASIDEAIASLRLPRAELARIGKRARARALDEHSGERRAAQLIALVETAAR